jgi:hypothetical protein
MITSVGHLLLAMLDVAAKEVAAQVVYCDTDSAVVTPSARSRAIAEIFESLNPYGVPVPFLKDETAEKISAEDLPKSVTDRTVYFFGLSSKRYCLFVRDKHGRTIVRDGSDHGLGAFNVPYPRREPFINEIWEYAVDSPEGDWTELYSDLPATSQFTLSTPHLLLRTEKLGDIRPGTFMTVRFREPTHVQDAEASFEFVPKLDPVKDSYEWRRLALRPDAKTWAHVLSGWLMHRDRKYRIDGDGQIVRRHILVRREDILGTGKETKNLGPRARFGMKAAEGAAMFVPVEERLLAMTPSEGAKLGIPKRTLRHLKHRLRGGRGLPRGHGSRTAERVVAALTVGSEYRAETARRDASVTGRKST